MSKSMKVEVNVRATLNEDKGVDFHCSWEDESGAWRTGPITVPYGYSKNKLEFHLDDRTGLNLEFLDDPHDAIWFDLNACPTSNAGNDVGQITDKNADKDAVSCKREKLTLTNLNTKECTLHYALRFTGKEASVGGIAYSPPYVCDPELRNRGGGQA